MTQLQRTWIFTYATVLSFLCVCFNTPSIEKSHRQPVFLFTHNSQHTHLLLLFRLPCFIHTSFFYIHICHHLKMEERKGGLPCVGSRKNGSSLHGVMA